MYTKILSTLFEGERDQACKRILWLYAQQGFCVVDYLYFANITAKKLFTTYTDSYPVQPFAQALLSDYKTADIASVYALYQTAILDADIVLMDGIALQLFYFLAKKKWLANLNGTDFCPYFLAYITRKYPDQHMNIILYGTYPHLLNKTAQLLSEQWYNVIYAQDGYTNLDWNHVATALQWKEQDINILLNARSTPVYPIQEIWTLANKDQIARYWLIVMNQWGTFDFWVGEQKRAPKLVRSLKLERLWRLISDPKRNFKKVWSTLGLFGYIFFYLILKKE